MRLEKVSKDTWAASLADDDFCDIFCLHPLTASVLLLSLQSSSDEIRKMCFFSTWQPCPLRKAFVGPGVTEVAQHTKTRDQHSTQLKKNRKKKKHKTKLELQGWCNSSGLYLVELGIERLLFHSSLVLWLFVLVRLQVPVGEQSREGTEEDLVQDLTVLTRENTTNPCRLFY